jgi:predicted transcriptional regulator
MRPKVRWSKVKFCTLTYNGCNWFGEFLMTLTLTLSPQLEALLQKRAEQAGKDVSSLALAVLAFGLSIDEPDFFEALEGIQRGLDDFERGDFCSFEDFVAEQNQKYGLSLET